MRKLCILLLCALLLMPFAAAQESDSIQNVEASVTVDSNGECRVSVQAEVKFTSAPKQFVFPLGAEADDISAGGAAYEEETIDGVECVVFENSIGFSGTQNFLCSYTLPCNMTEDASGQYFSLQLPERGFALPMEKFSLTLTFPVEVTALPTWHSAYYSDVIDNYMSIQVAENTVTASSNRVFKDHETLRMELSFAPDSFDLRHLPGQVVPVFRILFWLLAALSAGYWFFRLRGKLRWVKPLQAVNFEAGAGELPCQMQGQLPDMPAMLAHWGELGYVTIRKTRRGRILVEKQMDMGNERKAAERRLFDAIFRTGNSCDTQSLRFLDAAKGEAAVLRASWLRRLFQPSSGSPKLLRLLALLAGLCACVLCFDLWLPARASRWVWLPLLALLSTALCLPVQQAVLRLCCYDGRFWLCAGAASAALLLLFASRADCLMLMLLAVLMQLLCALATRFGGQRNKVGEELLLEVLGLRSFLRRADRDTARRLQRADSQYFYRMLPYAEVLGIGSAFTRRFADDCKTQCRWLRDDRGNPRNAQDVAKLYAEIALQIRLQCRFTRMSAPEPRRRPPVHTRRRPVARR